MEFNIKLQELRKQKGITQEQLAEQLFVSRTAISKWEIGKGYPNLESLKALSKIFSVSIDELLSGEELIQLASTENSNNLMKTYGYIFAVLDVMAIALILLPLYGQPVGGFIQSVNLLAFTNTSQIILAIYWTVFVSLIVLGCFQLGLLHFEKIKYRNITQRISLLIQMACIIFCFATREPYVGTLLFVMFVLKSIIFYKEKQIR